MPSGYQGYSATDWARSMVTTLANHVREEESAWMKNFQMLALLEQNSRITYNHGGRGLDWNVRYKRHNIEGYTGEQARNFPRTNLWKQANLPYRGYQATDAIFEKETQENKGEEAVIKVYEGLVSRLEESMKQGLATEPYIDGNATGNEQLWHGLESFFGATQTINISTGAARTANAADKCGYPNDTYAGLSTVLGNYGGEQESAAVWPDGVSDPEYDFWSPLIVNYTSTAFSGSADTFAAQGDEAMRYANIMAQRNTSTEGNVSNVLLGRGLYNDFLNLIDNKEQIQVTGEMGLRALGFKNVVIFDGLEVSWETACPSAVGYGINYKNIELMCMYGQMFKSQGPVYDIDSDSYKAVVTTLSNLRFKSPRGFFKLLPLA